MPMYHYPDQAADDCGQPPATLRQSNGTARKAAGDGETLAAAARRSLPHPHQPYYLPAANGPTAAGQEPAKDFEPVYQQQPEPPAEQPPAHRSATKGEHPTEGERQKQTIPPEIEQQRALSIQKDVSYKTSALRQLIVASIELIKLLPGEQSEFLQLLLTPRIREAFHFVEEKNPFLSLDAQH